MPQALPLLAGYGAAGVVAATGAYAWVASIVGGLVAFGTTKILGLDDQPRVPEPGVKATIKGTVAPLPIIYGRRRTAGALVQICTTGKVQTALRVRGGLNDIQDKIDNKFLNQVVAWCEGEIDSIVGLYFNDKLSTATRFEGKFTVDHRYGTDDQTASAPFLASLANTFVAESADKIWTTNHRLLGVAYTYGKFEYNQTSWPTGVPVMSADIKGRKVLDVRTSTWGWSDNPALCVYDYLTNTRFGCGIDPAEIDTQSFIDAANYCDQAIFIETQAAIPPDVPQAGVTQVRYTCDALLNPDDSLMDNLKQLLGTCRGALVFSGGAYRLRLDKIEPATFQLTEDNIVGGWNILLESTDTRYNRVNAQWINKAQTYQQDLTIVESIPYRENDNGQLLEARIDLPATTNEFRARQLAGIVLRQSRYSLQCEVTCTIEGLEVEVFDVIEVTHETPGWDRVKFRVMAIELLNEDQVRLKLQQYADEVYDLDSQNVRDSPDTSYLPDPGDVQAPTFLEGQGFVRARGDGVLLSYIEAAWYISWAVPVYTAYFELRYRLAGSETPWTILSIPPDATSPGWLWSPPLNADIVMLGASFPADPLVEYDVEVRTVNTLGVRSAPATAVLVGGGDLAPPPVPSGVHFSGDPNGVRIRWNFVTAGTRMEVWRTDVDFGAGPFSTASLVATISGTSYTDIITGSSAVGYWLRHLNAAGVPGSYTPSESGIGTAVGVGLPSYANDAAAGAAGLLAGDLYRIPPSTVAVKT